MTDRELFDQIFCAALTGHIARETKYDVGDDFFPSITVIDHTFDTTIKAYNRLVKSHARPQKEYTRYV